MKKILLFAAAFVSATLSSCNDAATDSATNGGGGGGGADTNTAITFTPDLKKATRVSDNFFDIDDQINVRAYDNGEIFAANVPYSYNGDVFASQTPIFFDDKNQSLEFWAVYPAIQNFNTEFDFSVSTDQSRDDNYETSDLLISMTDSTSDNCPTLHFNHVMSNIVMNIDTPNMGGGELTFYGATATCISMTEGINYNDASNVTSITAADNGYNSFKAIIVPQVIEAGTLMATYTVNGETYEWILDDDITFNLGHRYTYDWDLIENLVSFDTYIEGWEDGNTDGDSDTQVDPDIAYNVSLAPGGYVTTFELNFGNEANYEIIGADSWIHTGIIINNDSATLFIGAETNFESFEPRYGEIILAIESYDDNGEGSARCITIEVVQLAQYYDTESTPYESIWYSYYMPADGGNIHTYVKGDDVKEFEIMEGFNSGLCYWDVNTTPCLIGVGQNAKEYQRGEIVIIKEYLYSGATRETFIFIQQDAGGDYPTTK